MLLKAFDDKPLYLHCFLVMYIQVLLFQFPSSVARGRNQDRVHPKYALHHWPTPADFLALDNSDKMLQSLQPSPNAHCAPCLWPLD